MFFSSSRVGGFVAVGFSCLFLSEGFITTVGRNVFF